MDDDPHFQGDDRRQERRQLLRFDPTVSSGTLLQMLTLLVGFLLAYGTYTSDKRDTENRIEQLRKDVDNNRGEVRTSLKELGEDTREIQRSLSTLSTEVKVMNARSSMPPIPRRELGQ